MATKQTVAVIGLGAFGLVTLKNLLEEGFEAVGFERSGRIGGLWQFEAGPKTTVLESTIGNVSKQRFCYTDFPFPKSADVYPPATQVGQYLEEYAENFSLTSHVRLNSDVRRVSRNDDRNKWVLNIAQTEGEAKIEEFDRLVFSTGIYNTPYIPSIEGIEKFKGKILHSNTYKRPLDFEGSRVLVIGLSNSAGDTCTTLVGHAKKIYLSHRGGSMILPRWINGKPLDHTLSFRLSAMMQSLTHYSPYLSEKLLNAAITNMQNKAHTLLPEWNLALTTPFAQSLPLVSDDLVPALHAGTVTSVSGLAKVIDAQTVKLSDGTQVEVDAIIFCTGYKASFSVLGEHDPARNTTPAWAEAKGSNGNPLPRLYQNIFSLDYPDSLAFMSGIGFQMPVFQVCDLASMALAQIWKGNSALPSKSEMTRHVDEYHAWMVSMAQQGSVSPSRTKAAEWLRWANDAAGTGVNENLGYGVVGWKFWMKDREFCKLLMDGLFSPHIFRVFEGKRRRWEGAREAIERDNREKP